MASYWDYQELAGAALGLTEEQTAEIINDDEDFDTPLMNKFGVDFEQFMAVAEALLKLTPTVQSAITKDVKNAFVRQLGGGNCCAIVQQQYIEPKPALEQVQKDCDHDWEVFKKEDYKQCTYTECQLKRPLDEDDQ